MKIKYTESSIQAFLANCVFNKRINIIIPNAYYGLNLSHECDILIISKNRYCTEIEIKLTIADLKQDNKKFKWQYLKYDPQNFIKYYWIVMPKSIYDNNVLSIIQPHAGIMLITDIKSEILMDINKFHWVIEIIRKPKFIKAIQLPIEYINKANHLLNMRYWNIREKIAIKKI